MHYKVCCLDFDGVINDYPGWQNEGYSEILGEPMGGAKEAIKALRNRGYLVLVHSTRCSYSGGMVAITEYLNKYNIRVDGVCSNKPPADVYVDDKAVAFRGDWGQTLRDVETLVENTAQISSAPGETVKSQTFEEKLQDYSERKAREEARHDPMPHECE